MMIQTKICVDFFNFQPLRNSDLFSKKELAYYSKYKTGSFSITDNTKTILIEPADLYYLLFNLLLRWIPKIDNDENMLGTLMFKENYGLVVNQICINKLHIYEYCFSKPGKNPRDTTEITQEVMVDKKEFITKLYINILEFKKFYKKTMGEDLSFWNDDFEKAKKLVDRWS